MSKAKKCFHRYRVDFIGSHPQSGGFFQIHHGRYLGLFQTYRFFPQRDGERYFRFRANRQHSPDQPVGRKSAGLRSRSQVHRPRRKKPYGRGERPDQRRGSAALSAGPFHRDKVRSEEPQKSGDRRAFPALSEKDPSITRSDFNVLQTAYRSSVR